MLRNEPEREKIEGERGRKDRENCSKRRHKGKGGQRVHF